MIWAHRPRPRVLAATDIDLVDWKTGAGNLAHGLDFIATGIEMDVDRETGQVRLIRAAHGDDAGQPIHPVMLEVATALWPERHA
jgi:CO/xanthine dehydrogenase Mo-binding subunit